MKPKQANYNFCQSCEESTNSLHKSGKCKKCRSKNCNCCGRVFEVFKLGQVVCYKCRPKYKKPNDRADFVDSFRSIL